MTTQIQYTMSPEIAPGVRIRTFHSELGKHRTQRFDAILAFNDDHNIGGISATAVRIKDKWFVVANSTSNDDKFTDLGPFPTAEAALVCIRLGKDRS